MKKFWTKLVAIALGAAMALGVGFAVSSNSSKAIPVHAAGTTVSYLLSSTGWENQSQHETLLINEHLTATASSGSNTGKFYTSDNSWRFYANESATLTISGDSTVSSIDSITLTFSVKDSGIVKYGNTNVISGTAKAVSGTSVAFNISQSSGNKGKVFFTALSITYTPSSTPVETHSIIFNANGSDVTNMPANLTNQTGVVSLADVSEPSRMGYTFMGWSLTTDGAVVTSVTVSNADVNVYAIWEATPTPTATAKRYYSLVTSTDSLVAGAKYIIVGHTTVEPYDYYAMSTTQNTNNRGQESITVSETVASVDSDAVEVITLGGSTGAWTFGVDGGYLYAASSSKNYLRTQETNDSNGEWSISITSEGVVTATAQGSNSHNLLQYNSSSSIFSAYANAQRDIYLYRLDFGETLLGNVNCDGLGSHSFPEGYTWNDDLQSVYNDLPAGEKTALVSSSSDGLLRYDYIIGKYNPTGETDPIKTNYVHFITGRTIHPVGNARIVLSNIISNDTAIPVIILVSVLSLTSIGAYIFIRKRKEN